MIGSPTGLTLRSRYSDITNGVSTPEFERTVSRRLVRRAAVAEVMITDWRRLDDDLFLMYAQLPRAHSFYGPVGGVHDPLLIIELLRQATFLACHAGLEVPLDNSFVMNALDYRIDPAELRVTGEPARLEIFLDGLKRGRRRGTLSDTVSELHYFRDGRPVAQAMAKLSCLRAPVYRRLRGDRAVPPAAPEQPGKLPPPVTPALVGRDGGADVVLSPVPGRGGWLLRIDQSHPVLFDHPVDHVAGMVIIEAMRQAAQFVRQPARVLPVGLDSVFHRFVEFGEDCFVQAEVLAPTPEGDVPVRVLVEQGGALAAEGTVYTRTLS